MKTRMICPVGEPGVGKSTFSTWLFYELKVRGIRTEIVPEIIKYQSYSPEAIERVLSGNYDFRLLRQQHAPVKPLIGRVEVLVNEGALPPFFYYSMLRVAPDRLPALRVLCDRCLAEQQPAEHRYVTLVRHHPYENEGRWQTEAESQQLRDHLLDTLQREFAVTPTLLDGKGAWEAYRDQLVREVLAERDQGHTD